MQPADNDKVSTSYGIKVTLQELIELRSAAIHQPPNDIKKMALMGPKLTCIRGRGIEFDTTREYQAGDDIRSMAWRVTARSLIPHVKVYREEKERPVWLALDLSPSLYFGTRSMFKSVRNIKLAALAGWSSLLRREPTGSVINKEQKSLVFQPKTCEKNYLTILRSFAESSSLRPDFNDNNYLHPLLLTLQQHVRTGSIIYLYSDFFHFNPEIEKLIFHLSQRALVMLNFIYDPFEATPPPPNQYVVTNGHKKLIFKMQEDKNREVYRQIFQTKIKQLKDFSHKHQMSLSMFCTDPAQEIFI